MWADDFKRVSHKLCTDFKAKHMTISISHSNCYYRAKKKKRTSQLIFASYLEMFNSFVIPFEIIEVFYFKRVLYLQFVLAIGLITFMLMSKRI